MLSRRTALLFLAFALPPAVAGTTTIVVRLRGQGGTLEAAPVGDLAIPGPRPPTTRNPLAVILVGNHGTEITDSLPIVELLAASGAFEVRTVAPQRHISPFATNSASSAGLDFVPDLGFDEYAALVARTPDLLVVPYLHRWQSDDRAAIPWIRAHTGPRTTVLSICRGAELIAATGLFDGHAATANDRMLATLAAGHPAVRWQHHVRWVRDGRRMSSSLLAGGLDAVLAAIDAIAGRAAAEHAVAATGYPTLRALDDRSQAASRIPVGTVLESAYRWERARVGIVISDDVAESAVAGLLDAYAATYTTDTVAVAATRRVVRSRHGLALIPVGTIGGLGGDDRIVLAGAGRRDAYGYDLAIEEIARTRGGSSARIAGELLDYPVSHLNLPRGLPLGVTVAFRPLLIGLVSLLGVSWLSSRRRRGG